jgi:hypothetical protein
MSQADFAAHDAVPMLGKLPSGEFLTGLVERLSRPDNVHRSFIPDGLRVVLLMSARLTHDCAKYNRDASQVWHDNRRGNYHTKEARDRAIRDASDLADYAWDEAAGDAERAYALLVTPTDTVITVIDLLSRLDSLAGSIVTPSVKAAA